MEPDIKETADAMRRELKVIENTVRSMMQMRLPVENHAGEARAQTMLAVRHLEDARMRLGKVLQYGCGNGESCYDQGDDNE